VKLKVIDLELKTVGHAAVAAACQMIADEARRVIGTYDYGWPFGPGLSGEAPCCASKPDVGGPKNIF
jgi:hypothetical protein